MTTRADIPGAIRLSVLISAEAAAVVLFLHALTHGRLARFVSRNDLDRPLRDQLVAGILVAAVVGLLVSGLFIALPRWRSGASGALRGVDRLSRLGRLLAVFLVLWALPQMLWWRGWAGRELVLLVTAAAFVLLVEPALLASLSAARELGAPEWLRRLPGRVSSSRLARAAPALSVTAATLAYVGYASHYTVLQHLARRTTGFDLGGFGNLFWNTLHGRPFYCPIFHPRDTLYLMIHAEPIVYLLAPLYALRPDPTTLLVLQSVLMGTAAVPLYLFARARMKSSWVPVVLALAYLLFPALHASNFYDFHFLAIAPFFVLWAAYFLDRERWVLFSLACLAALACREDVALGAIIVGTVLVLSGHRLRAGAALAVVSAAYFVVVKLVLMPKYGDPSFVHHYARLVAPGHAGFEGVLKTLLTNPLYALGVIPTEDKLRYALHLLIPLAFLPLRDKGVWFLLLPGAVITLLSTDAAPLTDIRYQYVAHYIPYAFIAAALTLGRLESERGSLALWSATGALTLGTGILTANFGALNQQNFTSGHGKVLFHSSPEHRTALRNLEAVARTVPLTATLAATERDTPHLTNREHLFTLKYEDQSDAEYLLYAYDDLDYGAARAVIERSLRSGSHGFHAESPGYAVLRRGAPTQRNAELLEKIAGGVGR